MVFQEQIQSRWSSDKEQGKISMQMVAQVEGIGFEETYASVARIETIIMYLALSCYNNFKVYQMDVKSAFLNGKLEEEVYIEQPKGFLLSKNRDYVFKLKKALYGLKQAPRVWYSRLDNYLKKQGFKRGATESNLYLKIEDENMIIVVVYVDEIIFGRNLQILSVNFASEMKKEFEMSMLGELTFFLGLQVYQTKKGIFISQTKYIKYMLKIFKMEDSNPVSTPMITGCKLSKDDESLEVDHTMYISIIGSLLYVAATRLDVM